MTRRCSAAEPPEPLWRPVVPAHPPRLDPLFLGLAFEIGGRPALWAEVRRALVEFAGRRAGDPYDVAALRAWVAAEHEPTFLHYLEKFEGGPAAAA